ncbi:hypothetical protein A0256_13625 [Mucilaginibacter sp. PAMC 26640]|nr:hypothetical protein A0256_13625 [Mucilaginibacter sp. PAMC 26640]
MGNQTGQRQLVYTTKMDISDIRKNAKIAMELFKQMRDEAAKAVKVSAATGLDTKPITNYQQAQLALRKTLLEAQAESQRLKNENLALDASYKQGRISAQEAATAERQLRKDRRDLVEATKAARVAERAAAGSYDEANQKLKDLGRSIKAAEGGFKSTSPAIQAQIKEYNSLNDSIKKFDASMGNHQRNVGNYKTAVQGLVGDLKSMAFSYLSVQGALQLATASFGSNRQLQAIDASLKFTLGSTEAASDKIKELRDNALLLGQDFLPVAESYAKFAGAARAANFPLSETDRIFKAVSVAGARFNLTADQVSGALLAVQQMISKGTVQSEELRGQLGERLPGAFAIAAKAMNVNEKALGKMLQTGQVLAADLLPKLATQLEKDYGLKAGESIDNLNSSVGRLSTSFDLLIQGDRVGGFFKQIIDGAAAGIRSLNDLINSGSYKELVGRLFTFEGSRVYDKANAVETNYNKSNATLKKENLNPIGTSNKNVLSALTDYSIADLEKLRNTYIGATKQAEIAVNTYRKGIASGDLTDGGKVSFKQATDNFNALQESLTLINTAYDRIKPKVLKVNKDISDSQLTSIKDIRKRIAELSALPGSALQGSDIDKRIDALKDRLKSNKNTDASDLSARNAFQKKINALHDSAVKKQESSDDQEIVSIKQKYAVMKKEAEDYYKKFGNGKVIKDSTGRNVSKSQVFGRMSADQAAEVDAASYSIQAKKNLELLDLEKKQYTDYEQYVSEFGSEMASRRFDKKIVDNKSFLKALQVEADKISSIPEVSRTGGQKDYLKELNLRIAAEKDAERGKYDDLLKQLQTYQQKEIAITEQYAKDRDALVSNPLGLSKDELATQFSKLAEKYKNDIAENTLSTIFSGADVEAMFSNLDVISSKAINSLIKDVSRLFEANKDKLNPIDIENTLAKLEAARGELIKRNPFAELGKSLEAVFTEGAGDAKKSAQQIQIDWSNLAKATSGSFNFINDAVQSTAFLKDALGEVGATALSSLTATAAVAVSVSAAIKTAEKSSVILAVISAALVVVQAIASVFSSIFNANDKRIEKTIKGYQSQLDALDRGFKQLERDVQRSVGESYYSSSLEEIKNLNAQQVILQEQLDAERSKKKADQSKIDAYQDKINEIPNQIADIQQSITDMLVQTTFKDLSSSLADAFTDAFNTGEDSLAKLNEAFNKVIANAVKKGLELKFLQPVVDNFIKDFADYMKDNGNSALGFNFDKYKDLLKSAGDSFSAGLTPFKQFFEDPASSSSTTSALGNSIKSITSDQANALEGITRGTYDLTKQLVVHTRENNLVSIGTNSIMGKMYDSAIKGLIFQEQIATNTFNTVEEVKKVIVELKVGNLKTIADNTKAGSVRGSGLGV